MKLYLLSSILGVGLCGAIATASAATINVSSFGDGSASLVNATAAYNAASAGDTIVFPASGSASWSSSLTIGKAVTMNGNGTTLTAGTALANGFFYVTGFSTTSAVRITGFTFNLVNLNGHGLLLDNLDVLNLRIDNNTFRHGNIQIEVGGCKGVVDHNNFINGNSSVYYTAGTRAQADASWASMAAGTSDALFFEDNIFLYDINWLGPNEHNACFDTFQGGKIVVRYNTFTATAVPATWTGPFTAFLAHGSASGASAIAYWQADPNARRGQSVIEFYNNTVTAKRTDFPLNIRGSANLIHDNAFVTGTGFTNTPGILFYEEEQWVFPQWSPSRILWPAEDQVHNSFIWANTFTQAGPALNPNIVSVPANSTSFVIQDRDYFLHAPQNSGGQEIFTGMNGASGSFPTDGSTYPTKGTMVFDASKPNAYFGYVPYTYPHPLSTGALTTVSPPSNATIHIQVTP